MSLPGDQNHVVASDQPGASGAQRPISTGSRHTLGVAPRLASATLSVEFSLKRIDHEDFVARFFGERYGLELVKISETTIPTPDFEVRSGNTTVAVLEVKTLESTILEVDAAALHAGGIQTGVLSSDNNAGRVAKKIHDAVRQLNGSELPKVLVLLNDGTAADEFDLQEAIHGVLSYDDGERISTLPAETRQRMKNDRLQIDLYIWLDKDDDAHLLAVTEAGRDLRSRYFDPSAPSVR